VIQDVLRLTAWYEWPLQFGASIDAERCGFDPQTVLSAAHSPSFQAQVSGNFRLGLDRDQIFGVPSFVYEGQLFSGHDRLDALRRALETSVRSSRSDCSSEAEGRTV
jgi:predicted DsbA family dithiol-disulfide isomerase